VGLGGYLLGLLFFAGTTGTVVLASALLARRRLTHLERSSALLAAFLLATAGVVVAHLVPGVLGLLSRPSALICALLLLALSVLAARGGRPPEASARPRGRAPLTSSLVSGAAAAGVAGFWVAGTWHALGTPTRHIDTLTFHLPDVTRWIQTGTVWGVHQFVPLQVDGYYPQTGDVVYLAAVLPWMNDAFVGGVNALFGLLGALAVYAIVGELGGRREHAVLGAALFASIPALVATAFRGAQTDTIMVATLGGGFLFLLRHVRTGRRSDLLLAAVGLGLAFGSKWSGVSSVVVAIGGWAIALVVTRRHAGRVAQDVGAAAAVTVLLGGVWLVRNWAQAGNPVFPVELAIAGVSLLDAPRHVLGECANYTVANYLADGAVWRRFLIPGYRVALGLTGVAALVALAVTIGLALRAFARGARSSRASDSLLVAGVAVALVAVYLVTPGSALGLRGAPVNLATQVRYLLPALLLGAALLGWGLGRTGRARLLVELLLLVAIAASLASARAAPPARLLLGSLIVAVVVMVLAFLLKRRGTVIRAPLAAALVTALCAGLVTLGFERQQQFNDHRYRGLDPTLDWIIERAPQGHRIALAGRWTVRGPAPVLPAFGPRLGNEVTYLGEFKEGHLREYEDPASWRQTLARGRYDLLLVGRGGYTARACPIPGAEGDDLAWAREAGLPEVARSARFTLYRVPAPGP
jgi:Dolichyl-phosphate-mannose-protein mannosyltransferase